MEMKDLNYFRDSHQTGKNYVAYKVLSNMRILNKSYTFTQQSIYLGYFKNRKV